MSAPVLIAEALKIQRGVEPQTKLILKGNIQCGLVLQPGRLYHLDGASGCGKSTLLWTLARMYPLAGGLLRLNGQLHTDVAVVAWRTEVALLPQQPVIILGTIADNLLYPLNFRQQRERLKKRGQPMPDSRRLQQELQSVGLNEVPLTREAISLSGGQQARLALLRILLTNPQIVLADEPMSGLDEMTAALVFKRLDRFCDEGGTILMTSHRDGQRLSNTQIILDGHGELQFQTGNRT